MWRAFFRSLRARMALLLAVAVLVTAASTAALIGTLGLANDQVERLVSAQQRLDLLSSLSGRIGDYALVALQAAEAPDSVRDTLDRARLGTLDAFERFEAALGEDVMRLSAEPERTMMAARSRTMARLRAQFEVLDRQVRAALIGEDRIDRVRVALDVFAAGVGSPLGHAMEEERIAAQDARAAIHRLRERTIQWGMAGVALAVALAVLIYQLVARSLVRRVTEVAGAAAAIARGRTDTRLTITGHDELSFAMARFNRMATQLARREARLVADQRHLQEIVDARTAELRAANARLESVDQARRRFFTDVSHELRTPLTVILGEAEVTLRPAAPQPDDLRAALLVIQARARRLHRRVEDLLRIARSETGQIELDRALVPVADLIDEACESTAPLARAAGLRLEVGCARSDLAVHADREWLRQVLEGLIANAVRHSPAGSVVRILAQDRGSDVAVCVVDHGAGIPGDELPHVFERFWRGAAAAREGGGFGIGLALAKWIVESQGGAISIASDTGGGEGAGTTVTLLLPAAVPHLSLEAAQ